MVRSRVRCGAGWPRARPCGEAQARFRYELDRLWRRGEEADSHEEAADTYLGKSQMLGERTAGVAVDPHDVEALLGEPCELPPQGRLCLGPHWQIDCGPGSAAVRATIRRRFPT